MTVKARLVPLHELARRPRVRPSCAYCGIYKSTITDRNTERPARRRVDTGPGRFDVPVSSQMEIELKDLRIREVSRNHGGSVFQLRIRHHFPRLKPLYTSVPRAARLSWPSYTVQLQTQRDNAKRALRPLSRRAAAAGAARRQ